ncbi:hypothetical protein K469DRAFT_562794 [Zopfia rhizophila CBS 207.26]|uniref:Large ribosomal subunit protein uL23m n=1 Tax=Zopfia rhizophila CBS 207.26 TaxID=1314779 RepID=A0A6A6EGG2_9PEZI|nr:hypothetical protein K469DRAFT_562794 [Zopfia rhizophila CBS 207.26]
MADLSNKIIRFGKKQVFLPKFTIALMRSSHLSPYHARFLAPLTFSKLDLRDYLYHAYNVKAINIRSHIKQQPVQQEPVDRRNPNQYSVYQRRHWRPQAKKYMTIEMDRPFVWPAEPENFEAWGKTLMEEQLERQEDKNGRKEESESLRKQVKRVRENAQEFKPSQKVVQGLNGPEFKIMV